MTERQGDPDQSGSAGSSSHARPELDAATAAPLIVGVSSPERSGFSLLFLLLGSCFGLAACILTLALAGTPEVAGWINAALRAALGSSAVGFLLAGTAILWLLALCAAAWERSEQRYARETQERADRLARELARETSSLIDDSPKGPLPEEWRAPCGELVRFPDNPSGRGPKAA